MINNIIHHLITYSLLQVQVSSHLFPRIGWQVTSHIEARPRGRLLSILKERIVVRVDIEIDAILIVNVVQLIFYLLYIYLFIHIYDCFLAV